MISGISVQPSTTASQPSSFMPPMTRWKIGDRLRLEDAAHQLVHDDAIDLLALGSVRAHVTQPARRELLRVDLALDQPARSDQAEATEPALRRPRRQRPRRCAAKEAASAARPEGSAWWMRVVGADQKIGADLRELAARRPASARPRPPNRRGRGISRTRRAKAYASTPRDGRAVRAAPRLPRRWSDSKGQRLRRSTQRCRYAGACDEPPPTEAETIARSCRDCFRISTLEATYPAGENNDVQINFHADDIWEKRSVG